MHFRKPEWLDSAVGIAGLGLSVLALLAGSTLSARGAAFGALGFSVFIILISIFFRPHHAFRNIPIKDQAAFLEKSAASAEEIILINPSGRDFDFGPYVGRVLDKSTKVSVIGCAPVIQELMKLLHENVQDRFLKTVFLSESVSDEAMICFVSKNHRGLTIMALSEHEAIAFQLWDHAIVSALLLFIRREHTQRRSFARLDHASDIRKLLAAFDVEQQKYLQNFETLRQGYVVCHGTEVQQLQSSLVERGQFKQIDTLDITTSPHLLLLRKRYLEANAAYIKQGGKIRRVYMIEDKKLDESEFMADMAKLAALQRAMGVTLGLMIIDELEPSLRKDFILYDDAVVLVEDRQANLDYTLGQSTAYFDKATILRYRVHFNQVWSHPIGGNTPEQRMEKIFPAA